MRLSDIKCNDIENLQLKLVKSGKLSNKSINFCLGTLSSMFTRAVKWKMVKCNPVEVEGLPTKTSEFYNWWDQQAFINRFVENLNSEINPIHSAFLLALECGFRIGEVVALDKSDINFNLCRIDVVKSWDDKFQKVGPTKNLKPRTIGFKKDGLLANCLKQSIEYRSDLPCLFPSVTGKRLLCRNLSERYLKPYIKRLGLPPITIHGLRHTFASWYLISGQGDIYKLQRLLGHSSVHMTEKYIHNLNEASSVAPIYQLAESISGGVKNHKHTKNPQKGGLYLIKS